MVKAIKRKPERVAETEAKKVESNKVKKQRKMRNFTLIALGLMVMGWTVGSYVGLGARNDQAPTQPIDNTPKYGIGIPVSSMNGTVLRVGNTSAVFGQLEAPLQATTLLSGDLYLIDEGVNQLIITKEPREEIEKDVLGNYIIYNVSSCGEFDCLLDDRILTEMAENASIRSFIFDVYELNMTSYMLKTSKVGFPM